MVRPINEFHGLSEPDVKVLQDIRRISWHVTGVFPNAAEAGGNWAFSTGLFFSFAHPEIILLGLELNTCISLVNEVGTQVKNGKRFESNGEYPDILAGSYRCAFREVSRSYYKDYLGVAIWFYEHDTFPVLQCIWPDKTGKFPWQAGCNQFVQRVQPVLFDH